jgi:DHA2 family methylenomycin A resistance protein-like MFS transporter
LAAAQALAVMSTTVVSVALPAIGAGLHASSSATLWIVDAYVIVYSSLLVVGGTIGDRCGRKGVFMLGLVLFGIGSLADSLAPTTGWLLAARVVQGLGPVLLVPGSLTIIRVMFADERRRAQAIGLWSTGSGLGMSAGPVVGGLIAAHLGWRWVFGLNVPLAAILLLLAARTIPRLPRATVTRRLDWLGTVLVTGAIAALAYGLIEGNPLGWTSARVLAAFVVSACALTIFVARELRVPDPVVDVRLFRRPAVTAANVAALTVFFAFIGALVFLSEYFQQVKGDSPVAAGLRVAVLGVAFAIAAPVSGRLVGRIGPRWPMLVGLVAAGVAMLGLVRLDAATGFGSMWWDFALAGAGVGLCLTPMTQVAVSAVEPARAGMASAVHNALRQFGQVLGVAVLGAIIGARGPVAGLDAAMWVSGIALLAAALLTGILVFLGGENHTPQAPLLRRVSPLRIHPAGRPLRDPRSRATRSSLRSPRGATVVCGGCGGVELAPLAKGAHVGGW